MGQAKRLLLGLVCVLGLALSPKVASAATNTNECVADLGGIQACQDTGFLGLPKNLGACCDGVRELAVDRCECNPALDVLLGEEGQKIYDLEPLCRIVQAKKWLPITPRIFRSCKSVNTHKYGCGPSDVQIDAARLQSILAFSSIFQGIDDEQICLDTPAFVERLSVAFQPDIHFTVPYGIGTYHGLEDTAEYLGMAFAGLNHGFWLYDGTVNPAERSRLDVSPDGHDWGQGSTQHGTFLRGAYPYSAYIEQVAHFEGCDTKIKSYDVLPTEGMRDLIEIFTQSADLSTRWGVQDICRYHTQYCAADPSTRQFESEQDCLDYIGSLPLYTEKCGPNRPLAGHSLSCKFKHHLMIPTNPQLHCPHIGKMGGVDPHGNMKCNDDTECSTDQGQASWPPVTEIGAGVPQSVVDIFEDSNIDFENEPFGCAVPTEPREHDH
jgi:hypothetical protein